MKTNNTAPLSSAAQRRIEKAMDDLLEIAASAAAVFASLGEVLHPSPKRTTYVAPLTPDQKRRNAKLVNEMFKIAEERVRPLPKRR